MTSAYGALSQAAYKSFFRDRVALFFSFAFPLVFLVAFGLIYKGQSNDGHPFIDYVGPGIISYGVANGAMFGVAYSLMTWRKNDLLRLIRMTPTSVPQVLSSRYLLAVVVGILQSLLFVAIAVTPMFGMQLSSRWPLGLLVLVCAISAFFGLGVLIGALVSSPEAVGAIANSILVPMAFFSGVFYPLRGTGEVVTILSHLVPLRYASEGLSITLSGTGAVRTAWLDCAALLGFAIVFGAVATRTFRWSRSDA